jgi:hypothetical protein
VDRKITRVKTANLQNSQLKSWDWDNFIQRKIEKDCKVWLPISPMLKDEIEKIIIKKIDQKMTQVNTTNS